ncbi:MAG: hypothetical protein O7D34_10130 [Ignavibacteria bacterium]|nr:hypothetical protein [Ignavibacteria bacterium]
MEADTIIREIPPLTAIEHLLSAGTQWTFRPSGRPFRIDKQVGQEIYGSVNGMMFRYFEVRRKRWFTIGFTSNEKKE